MCSYWSECNLKVKKELSNELMHIYVEKYSQNTLESELCTGKCISCMHVFMCSDNVYVVQLNANMAHLLVVSVKMTHLLTGNLYVYVFVFVCIDSKAKMTHVLASLSR